MERMGHDTGVKSGYAGGDRRDDDDGGAEAQTGGNVHVRRDVREHADVRRDGREHVGVAGDSGPGWSVDYWTEDENARFVQAIGADRCVGGRLCVSIYISILRERERIWCVCGVLDGK